MNRMQRVQCIELYDARYAFRLAHVDVREDLSCCTVDDIQYETYDDGTLGITITEGGKKYTRIYNGSYMIYQE